jgi:hypothetical protein
MSVIKTGRWFFSDYSGLYNWNIVERGVKYHIPLPHNPYHVVYLLGITYIVKQAVIMVYLGRKQAQQYIRKGVPLENNGECCRVEQSNILVADRGLSVGEGSHNLIYRVVPRVPQVANKGVSSKYGVVRS